ncbi:hypothetical protein ACTFIW_008257 [Dictyostelium discoideum]
MMVVFKLLIILSLISIINCKEQLYQRYRSPFPYYSKKHVDRKQQEQEQHFVSNDPPPPPPPYQELFFLQTLDHFNFQSKGEFAQRYLVSDVYWKKPSPNDKVCQGPILFYTGNEGDITLFYDNSQFVTNVLAQEMNALLIFAEHRYYGESLPFGNDSWTSDNIGYLTSEQALADYAQLIPAVLSEMGAEHCPVLSVGGSYGGMLTAWFRMKYPNIVDGALAASAPILSFLNTGVNPETFNKIATDDFKDTSSEGTCASRIRSALNDIVTISTQSNGLAQLSKTFSVCGAPLTDVNDLINWIESALTYMAMADYPYPANFLEPMPGYPINVSCSALAQQQDDIQGLLEVLHVYYNYTGQAGTCYNMSVFTTGALGDASWDYQACTEMVMPVSSDGVNDFFPPSPFSLSDLTQQCQQQFQTTPDPYWITTYYGGSNFSATNIIFSNGVLDVWRSGGILETRSDSIVALTIEGGAHHLDLRYPNPLDPPSVTQAREIESKLLQLWASEASLLKQRK